MLKSVTFSISVAVPHVAYSPHNSRGEFQTGSSSLYTWLTPHTTHGAGNPVTRYRPRVTSTGSKVTEQVSVPR